MAANHIYDYLTSYLTSYITRYVTRYMTSCVKSYLIIPVSRNEQSRTKLYGHRVLHLKFH